MPPAPPALPSDVWSNIASYLPAEELRHLYGVNKPLFDLSMAERYRSVCFCGDSRMKWLCKNIIGRLVRNYVQVIEIQQWQIEEKAAEQWSWIYNLSFLRSLMRKDDEWLKRAEERRRSRKMAKAVERISEAVKQLPNVQEYRVQCPRGNCHLPLVSGLIPTLTNWKDSLVKLTLCVPPDTLVSLAHVKLDRLENLELFFWAKPTESFQYMVIEPMTVFINNLYHTLHSFSATATRDAAGIDLAPLFKDFGTFPHLRHLALTMPYDGSSFSTLEPLLSFLGSHKKLQSLHLSTSVVGNRPHPTSAEQKQWIPQILKLLDSSFKNIQEVNVALRPLKAPATSTAIIEFLSIHGHNLTSLALTEEESLTLTRLQEILQPNVSDAFYHLECLALNVDGIRAALFTFLVKTFPRLKQLKIGFNDFPHGSLTETFQQEFRESQLFYHDWSLKRIDFLYESPMTPVGPYILEATLKASIPSLETVAFLSHT